MDMVVAEAGGSKATLYRYFPSKEALVLGLIGAVGAAMHDVPPDPAADTRAIEDALTDIGTAAMRGVLSEEALAVLRLCLGEADRHPALARAVWEAGPAVTYANMRAFIEERVRRGELRPGDAQLDAEHFVAGLVGHLQPKVAMGVAPAPDEEEIRRRVAAAVDAFLRGHGAAQSRDRPSPTRGAAPAQLTPDSAAD